MVDGARGHGEWGSFTDGFADALAGRLSGLRVLETFAGNGRLAAMLASRGVAVTATSLRSGHDGHARGFHHPVLEMDAYEAVARLGAGHDVLLMSWPTVTEAATAAALEWGDGRPLLFLGEVTDYARGFLGGCATDLFFEVVAPVGPLAGYEGRSVHDRALEFAVRPGCALRWREGARTARRCSACRPRRESRRVRGNRSRKDHAREPGRPSGGAPRRRSPPRDGPALHGRARGEGRRERPGLGPHVRRQVGHGPRSGAPDLRPPGGRTARARMQVVGTHSAFEGRFLWGWANGSVPGALRAHALLARSYGVERGVAAFSEPSFAGDEDTAWEAASVVLHLSGAAGAYRAPIGHTTLFLTFGEAVVGRAS